ncbi:hypothetical protein SA2016_0865 [Sinomonas atrocyanea]|uniref:Uncharacterized protein n=1 Tax=Sinomonas atrocyanea TaxID=37927 RepID=A0A126ZWT0_9MICC|nr:DUF6454 family protein [Sinomonas atrocyanea]AMM31553.1 hypothetical protein SA2016_0865 [Sinomonas atrocyanea]GEB66016.1 hypothetical protein SAT01_34640 [Sinomonas atrocyanea]GGG70232.1 hypothetical protein GCM10007172_23090 [Sinomonas atrocyanea]
MWSEPPRDGSLSAEVASWTRRTRFELVHRLPLRFPTHHPQGMAFADGKIFLSTVEVHERPAPIGGSDDPARRTPGRGRGHVLVIGPDGTLAADLVVGDGDAYHPSGIDYAGGPLWVPVGEYRANSRSLVYTLDPHTLELTERFEVDDHLTWLAPDLDAGALYGAGWGSRRFYRWTLAGGATARDCEAWDNPSWHLDAQEGQYDGSGRIICAGISELPDAHGGTYELGGVSTVHFDERRITADVPVPLFSAAGHSVFRNPFVLTREGGEVLLHVAPDDGEDVHGTEILTYRVTNPPRPTPPQGALKAITAPEHQRPATA